MDLGIFRDSEVERGRELVLFGEFYLGSNFGLYNKGGFLTERTKVDNGRLTEVISSGLSYKF